MRLTVSQRIQPTYDVQTFASVLRDIETQVNQLTEGRVSAVTNATTAAPTAQSYKSGDFVKNSTPSVQTQSNAMSYVILGWLNTTSGTPGTFQEVRCLTGDITFNSVNFTGTNWTDLTDGGTTTLHTHVSGIASEITVANEATDTTCFPVFVTAATGNLGPKSNTGLTFNSATGALGSVSVTLSSGPLTIGANQVVTTRQTGWGVPSSTLARTTFATYSGQTINSTYGDLGTLFTATQAIDDHLKIVSQRLGALITDLITHGLIGT